MVAPTAVRRFGRPVPDCRDRIKSQIFARRTSSNGKLWLTRSEPLWGFWGMEGFWVAAPPSGGDSAVANVFPGELQSRFV